MGHQLIIAFSSHLNNVEYSNQNNNKIDTFYNFIVIYYRLAAMAGNESAGRILVGVLTHIKYITPSPEIV